MELNRKHNSEQAIFLKIAGSISSRIISFVKEMVVAALFGTTYVSDVVQLLEGTFVSVFGSIGSSIAVPFMYAYTERENKKEDIYLFLNQVFTICFFIGLLFATFIGIFPNIFLKIAAAGFNGDTLKYAIYSTRIMSSLVLSLVLIAFLKSLFFVQKDFILSSFYELFISLTTIIFLLINKNINFFPIIKASSYLGAVAILWIYFLIKERKALKFTFYKIKDVALELWPQTRPLFLSNIVLFISVIIDKNFASLIGTGAVSAQSYALKIYTLPHSIWAMQIIEASYPFMVEYYQTNIEKAKIFFEENLEKILFIIVPATVGLFVLSTPIVKLIYERGAFTHSDTILVGKTLASYCIYMLFFSLNQYIVNVFYARKYTKISYYTSAAQLTINIFLKWLFVFKLKMGLVGLGISSGLGEIVVFTCLAIYYVRLFKEKPEKNLSIDITKTIMASALMGTIAAILNKNNINLILTILLSALSYGIIILIIKENIAHQYLIKITEKVENGKNK
jgi:putative peptidoglycan lipid II flippase